MHTENAILRKFTRHYAGYTLTPMAIVKQLIPNIIVKQAGFSIEPSVWYGRNVIAE